MDIDLLSKMVKELIMTSDEVHLPGVGSFVAEIVPASFSDKGFTINPPYRRLYFRHRDKSPEDIALVDFYAESNGIDRENARLIITDFLGEMRELLEERKMIILPGLGRLRATKENNFFFVADEDLDIYPAGFGLERISLKSHEETRGEVSAAVASLKEMISAPVETVADTEPVTVEDTPAEEAALAEPVAAEEVVADAPVEPVAEEEVVADAPDAVAAETMDEVPEPENAEVEPVDVQEASAAVETVPVEQNAGIPVGEDASEAVQTEEVHVEEAPEPAVEDEPAVAVEEPHQEAEQESIVEEKPAETPKTPAAPAVEEVSVPEIVEPVSVQEEKTPAEKIQAGDTTVRKSPWKTVGKVVLYVLIAIAVLLMAYIAISHFAPEFIDSILYSPEELEIINYGATAS